MKENLVSIIMPSYNSASHIAQSIESVLAQSYSCWELLVVDDASSDNTTEIVQKFVNQDERIKLWALPTNYGSAVARNFAIQNASGQFLAFLDSDDLWLLYKLEKQLAFMNHQQAAFSFSAYQLIDDQGNALNKTIPVPATITYSQYLKNTIIGCLTVMLDRKQIPEIVFPNLRSSQDMALWLQILKMGIVAYGFSEPLACYRINPNSTTANKRKAAVGVWHVYRKTERLSLFFSLYNFAGYAFHALKKRIS
ncbi:MAG: glycosyltransferase [Bacteroidales bacterium]|jgi:teichuronic acid biosynthesis glycosyltransferase TuaG|nr:glycosyltransferase [Bacteroidales bacterium]